MSLSECAIPLADDAESKGNVAEQDGHLSWIDPPQDWRDHDPDDDSKSSDSSVLDDDEEEEASQRTRVSSHDSQDTVIEHQTVDEFRRELQFWYCVACDLKRPAFRDSPAPESETLAA